MNKPLKVIYIASLSHSGSTLLGMMLGTHPGTVCLGEILPSLLYGKGQSDTCTCGKQIDTCPVWNEFHDLKIKPENYAATYSNLADKATEAGKKTLVDCSKQIAGLAPLLNNEMFDIRVIWLLKDIRSFVHSQIQRKKRPELMKKDGWRRIYKTGAIYNIFQWRLGNGRILRFLKQKNIPFITVGYEELCLNTEPIMQ